MTPSDAPDIRSGLSGLAWKSWLILALALSAIGSQLTVWVLLAIYYLYFGNLDVILIVRHFFGPPEFFELSYVFLLSLIVNLCGALVLMAFFAIRRRLKS